MADLHAVLTASALAHTGPGILTGLVVSAESDATPPRVIVYDNTAASGTKILDAYIADLGTSQPFQIFFSDRFAPRFATGCYIAITGCVVNYWVVGK